jgi:hypothetical protein
LRIYFENDIPSSDAELSAAILKSS